MLHCVEDEVKSSELNLYYVYVTFYLTVSDPLELHVIHNFGRLIFVIFISLYELTRKCEDSGNQSEQTPKT